VRGLQKRADNTPPGTPIPPRDTAPDDSATARAELAALTVRAVPTFEHRELLVHALRDTRRRFLLITPQLRDAVVDQDLIAQLEILLRRRGLVAHIAHGLSHPDREQDTEAVNRLRRLAERYPNLSLFSLCDAVPHCLIFEEPSARTKCCDSGIHCATDLPGDSGSHRPIMWNAGMSAVDSEVRDRLLPRFLVPRERPYPPGITSPKSCSARGSALNIVPGANHGD
jgi:hypothetical protein